MPNTYYIKFNISSGVDNTYAFFVQAPELAPSDGVHFSNVWISKYVPDASWYDIETTDQFYACMS